jgi:hypothetical protein
MTQPFRLRPYSPHCVGFIENLAVLPQSRPVRNRPTNTPLSIFPRFVLSVNKIRRRLDSTPHEALTSMPDRSQPPAITLSLPPEEHWTLHHVLLDRIDQETTVGDTAGVDPPPVEVSGPSRRLMPVKPASPSHNSKRFKMSSRSIITHRPGGKSNGRSSSNSSTASHNSSNSTKRLPNHNTGRDHVGISHISGREVIETCSGDPFQMDILRGTCAERTIVRPVLRAANEGHPTVASDSLCRRLQSLVRSLGV